MNPRALISSSIGVSFRPDTLALEPHASVTGFLHLWAIYVRGFDPKHHCQRCLRGKISAKIRTRATPIQEEIIFDETSDYQVIYLCGVAKGRVADRRHNNLHLPLRPALGRQFELNTYNKYTITVKDAELLPIPLIGDWWHGFSPAFTRCCNFRFGLSIFGFGGLTMRKNAIYSQGA